MIVPGGPQSSSLGGRQGATAEVDFGGNTAKYCFLFLPGGQSPPPPARPPPPRLPDAAGDNDVVVSK